MLTSLAPILACAAAAACTAVAAAQEAPVIRFDLTEGRQLGYVVQQQIAITTARPDSDETVTESVHAAELRMTVTDVAESGDATVTITIPSAMIVDESDDGTQAFVGGAEVMPFQVHPKVVAGAPRGLLAPIGEALLASTIVVTVGPGGEVKGVEGLGRFVETVNETITDAGQRERVIGMFTEEKLGDLLGRVFGADGMAGKAARDGRGWQVEDPVRVPPLGVLDIINDWRVVTADGERAVFSATMSTEFRPNQDVPPNAGRMDVQETRGQTMVVWDVGGNALRSRGSQQSIDTVWTLGSGDDALRIKQLLASSIAIRRVDG